MRASFGLSLAQCRAIKQADAVARVLNAPEIAILEWLLSVDFPGVDQPRQQARQAAAERDGMIINLVVEPGAPRARVLQRVPVQAVVDGDGFDGGLLLYVDDGLLSALEYWWVTENPPAEMPPLSAVGNPIARLR